MQVPYLGLIQQTVVACPGSPMILLEAPHVGLRLQLRAREVDEVADAAAAILWRHGYAEACFVAHSYGTFCASRIAQLHRSLVHSLVQSIRRPLNYCPQHINSPMYSLEQSPVRLGFLPICFFGLR